MIIAMTGSVVLNYAAVWSNGQRGHRVLCRLRSGKGGQAAQRDHFVGGVVCPLRRTGEVLFIGFDIIGAC